ncbi:LacI family DNA-binding transcriptional regulator [Streptococcus moroccensis]|uniref:DNA-binding LacI/PurR family transcriptional regulator n=1 Tax=Streptococcus moroccensis TaxID=1451356 RepID=A0ABT9YRR0_9STRE|nr:substrate-binding domain-containing protein [Streptococcus moroccensis]MDQ0222587.1 DNA-binding LacI/PurR family transcriptional regulator [Streptococcus moroccensis]
MSEEKKVTLKDVAKLAGVSITTVSRVINGEASKSASIDVQNRVWEAVRTLSYVPNRAAQELKRKKSRQEMHAKTITCIFSRTADTQRDPFFSEISRMLETELIRRGYVMKLVFSSYHLTSHELDRLLRDEITTGVVVLGKIEQKHIEIIKRYAKFIVYAGVNRLNFSIDQVICDGYEAGWLAMEHLEKLGFDDIYYIGEVENEIRFNLFCDYIRKMKIKQQNRVIACDFSANSAYSATKKALETGADPKAIFCGNDVTALGVLRALREADYNVPKDVSIVSIDDIEMSQYADPMLTTVRVDRDLLGKYAAKLIINRIEEGNDTPIKLLLPPKLIVRDSTK